MELTENLRFKLVNILSKPRKLVKKLKKFQAFVEISNNVDCFKENSQYFEKIRGKN